jgi:hypothetical protein
MLLPGKSKAILSHLIRLRASYATNTTPTLRFNDRSRWLSSAPSAESSSDGNRKYMYAFGGLLLAANVFTVWQEVDAHDEEAEKLKIERQRAWEREQAVIQKPS